MILLAIPVLCSENWRKFRLPLSYCKTSWIVGGQIQIKEIPSDSGNNVELLNCIILKYCGFTVNVFRVFY